MHNHGLARGWFVIDEDKKMMVEEQQPDIPVTILTGFLGAGKTTLLNRILSENHNYKIAIVENEFGKENIDTDLLVQTDREQIVNMNNGCVCCTIRGDLSKVLTDLRLRRSRGEIKFDRRHRDQRRCQSWSRRPDLLHGRCRRRLLPS